MSSQKMADDMRRDRALQPPMSYEQLRAQTPRVSIPSVLMSRSATTINEQRRGPRNAASFSMENLLRNNGKVKIEMTRRTPIIVKGDEWPVIAHAADKDEKGDTLLLAVRRGASGEQALVYGVRAFSVPGKNPVTAGHLIRLIIRGSGHIVSFIKCVGQEIECPQRLIQTCIGALSPAGA